MTHGQAVRSDEEVWPSDPTTCEIFRDGDLHKLVAGCVEDAYFVRSECANDFPGSEWTLAKISRPA